MFLGVGNAGSCNTMATSTDVLLSTDSNNSETIVKGNLSATTQGTVQSRDKIYGVIFLSAVTGISALIGFGTTLASARKKDPKYFHDGVAGVAKGTTESGASLALRALGWGTVYAIGGCGVIFYGIWKLSGATNVLEFRQKMGSILPRIPKNDPPQSRTEFEGLTDLLTYISEDWGKNKTKSSK